MLWSADFVPWLCWTFPIVGAVFPIILPGKFRVAKSVVVVLFSFLAWLMAIFMIPDLFNYNFVDRQAFWFALPNGGKVGLGMLVDPLSIILVNVVAFLSLLILIYSLKYVEKDPGASRYWFLMSLFIGSMLLLILADNLILFFIGWKIVGLCSYALIGHYYNDEKEHWIGGPPPFSFQKPSRCGLKALLVTTFGDVSLLASIIILYLYSGTFNFIEIYQTAGVWLAEMAKNPGILTLTAVLFLAGPLAKSAQFPFHEWLPEAMAGPTPVSALIHAATMVKAGVYLVARVLPIFFFACWVANPNYPEALTFFLLVAAMGAFTAFLAGTQAMVSQELKKALAYSTMSSIGYMMLALGVAGLSPSALVDGVASGIFYLINHGIFKAALFLCAGAAIHASGSIYVSEMKLSKRKMRFTWLFMWIAALSLIGVPPLSGFWSKDAVLLSCWESGQYVWLVVAIATIIITTFYVVRFMGLMFHSEKGEITGETRGEEAPTLMLLPYGILAGLTVVIGVAGPWVSGFLHDLFEKYFTGSLRLFAVNGGTAASVNPGSSIVSTDIFLLITSLTMIIVGALPAYRIYISHKNSAEGIVKRYTSLQVLHKFLWNRWYIDAIYNRIFVNGALSMRAPLAQFVEGTIDRVLNVGIPNFFGTAHRGLKKVQTGVLSVNMLYFIALLIAMVLFLWLLGVL
jgi:NADH-quinone oxidoreductase subunit L